MSLAITKDGITLTLQEIKQRQDKQKGYIEINSKNIEANRDILKRLSSLEQEIVSSKSSIQLVSSNLVEPNELQHLYKLVNNEPFIYHKQCSFEQELRQLRTLGFLETKLGIQIHSLPESGDLKKFCNITEAGRKYLIKRESIQSEYDSSNSNNRSI